MIAVIIAGGPGTRLRPLTYNTPKPMVPLFDKPFLQYQLELLRHHGIADVVVSLHYLSESISEFFGDGSSMGMRIRYCIEETPRGTAGAVKLAEAYFDGDPVLVFNGDILTDLDLSELLAYHQNQEAIATLSTVQVPDPTAYGLIVQDVSGRINSFLEKPSPDEVSSNTVNAGIYVLEPSAFRYVPQNEPYSFERGLFPLLLHLGEPVYGYPAKAYWLDIGSPQKYLQVHTDILLGRVKVELEAKRRPDGIWVGQNVEIDSSAELRGPAYIAANVKIGKHARIREFTVLGPNVFIDDRATLEHTIVGAGSLIEEDASISHSIIGGRCRIGASAQLNEHVVLADHSNVARGSILG